MDESIQLKAQAFDILQKIENLYSQIKKEQENLQGIHQRLSALPVKSAT